MFGWFRRKSGQLMPEALWVLTSDEESVRVTDHTGEGSTMMWSALSSVAIETNDTGPWGADVWWLLFDDHHKLGCGFPEGATGEKSVVDRLTALPGFDHEQMIKAMGSTNNAVFPVWNHEAAPDRTLPKIIRVGP